MKNTINLFILVVLAVSITGCKVIIPNYTTVEGLSSLKPGMDKTEVLSTLQNVYPHDIYNGEGVGCEVHEYRYKHLYQRVDYRDQPLREGLRGNPQKWLRGNKAYVVYQDGKLATVHTNEKDYLATLLVSVDDIALACDPPVYGCMDPTSLNYNSFATVDDGTCDYCPCGTEKNPDYDPEQPESNCNIPCLEACPCPAGAETNPAYDPTKPISSCNPLCIMPSGPIIVGADEPECGPCEIVDAIAQSNGAKFNVNLDLNGYLDDDIEEFDQESSWFYRDRGRVGRIWKARDRTRLRKSEGRYESGSGKQWISKSLLRALDTDRNGVLTQKEISGNITYINNNRSEIQKGLGGTTISGIDLDGNGKISVEELTRVIDQFFEQD